MYIPFCYIESKSLITFCYIHRPKRSWTNSLTRFNIVRTNFHPTTGVNLSLTGPQLIHSSFLLYIYLRVFSSRVHRTFASLMYSTLRTDPYCSSFIILASAIFLILCLPDNTSNCCALANCSLTTLKSFIISLLLTPTSNSILVTSGGLI